MEMLIKFNKIFFSGIEALFKPQSTCTEKIDAILNVSDEEALKSDWIQTGNDLRKAMNIYGQKYQSK